MVAEQVHDEGPRAGGEDGPGIVADICRGALLRHEGQAVAGLDGKAGQGQHDAREDVYDNLLIHRRNLARLGRPAAKHKVAADQAGE